jgi:hypothetical protein
MRLAAIVYWRVLLGWLFLQIINRQIPQVHKFISEFLELQKYSNDTDCYRLFCFFTDSVFRVLVAYFDESMASIGGYEP